MPSFITKIPELENSVTRPVISQILVALQHHLHLDTNIEVKLLDSTVTSPLKGSNISDPDSHVGTRDKQVLVVTYEDKPLNAHQFQTMYQKRTQESLFRDEACGLDIYPVVSTRTVTLTAELITPSKIEAEQFANYINSRLSMSLNVFATNVFFQLPLPAAAEQLIRHALNLRNKTNKPIPLELYTEENNRIGDTILTNMAGEHDQRAYNYQYNEIPTYFAPDEIPTATREKDGTFTVDLKFEFNYDKPISINIKYPIYLYNEQVHPRYLNTKLDRNVAPLLPTGKNQNIVNSTTQWEDATRKIINNRTGFIVPRWDDWVCPSVGKQLPLFQVALFVDPEQPHLLVNLAEFADLGINIDSELVRWFTTHPNRAFNPARSPWYFRLYSNNNCITPDLTLTPSGDICANWELNPNNFYHLVLFVSRDLYWLDDETKKEIAKFPILLDKTEALVNTDTGIGSNGNGGTLVPLPYPEPDEDPDVKPKPQRPVTRPGLIDWIIANDLISGPVIPDYTLNMVNSICIYSHHTTGE